MPATTKSAKRSQKPATKPAKKPAKRASVKSAPVKSQTKPRETRRDSVAVAAELLCCWNGPKSKRVRTTQAIPSGPRVAMVKSAIGRRKPADVLGGKTAEPTGKRLGFANLNQAREYAAGRIGNRDVPIETRRAMAALASAVASGVDRTPAQTKVNGRVLVAILVALAGAR